MADEPIAAVPPEETPPVAVTEPVDEHGVPWKNRAAEWQRKTQEAEERAKQAAALNEQYMQALGQLRQGQPTTPQQASRLEQALAQYQPQDRQALQVLFQEAVERAVAEAEKRAEQVGYRMMTDANHSQQLQDQELMAEATKAFAIIEQNPVWSNASRQQKTAIAIAEARAALAAKKAPPTTTPQTLPGTSRPAATAPVPDKEKFIKDFIANPENREMYRSMTRKEPTEQVLREAAEIEWKSQQSPLGHFGPDSAVGKAAQAIIANAGRTQ